MLTNKAQMFEHARTRDLRHTRLLSDYPRAMLKVSPLASGGTIFALLLGAFVSSAGASAGVVRGPWDEADWAHEGGGIVGPPFQPVLDNVTTDCLRDSVAYVSSLAVLPPWVPQILQSSATVREGLQNAFPPNIGYFEGCSSFEEEDITVGKYCIANITLGSLGMSNATSSTVVEVNYLLTYCSSKKCANDSMSACLEDYLNRTLEPHAGTTAVLTDFMCKTWHREQPSLGIRLFVVVLLLFFGFVFISSTVYELFMKLNDKEINGTLMKVFVSFSAVTNFPKLMSSATADGRTDFIFGMKFLSISWIIFGHTFYTSSLARLVNQDYVNQFSSDWTKMPVLNESVAVDTFFLISGFLLALMFIRETERGVPFSLVRFYVHRFLRLTPPYAVVVAFYATLFYSIGSGPQWNQLVGVNGYACSLNWWTNLIYLNNFINYSQPCMDHSWYLAVDMQFYAFSPILLFAMHKSRIFKIWAFPLIVIVSLLVPFTITADLNLPGAIFFNSQADLADVFVQVYSMPYARAGPYLVGMGLGYFLHHFQGKDLVISKSCLAIGWATSSATCVAVIFGVYGMMQAGHEYNRWEAAFYAGFHRTVWALAISWIAFACFFDGAGPVKKILSWKFFIPLGRLVYSIYLCHYIVILYFAGTRQTEVYFSINRVVRNFLGNLVIATFLSAILCLVFESPFIAISKAFIKNATREASQGGTENQTSPPSSPSPSKSNSPSEVSLPSTLPRIKFVADENEDEMRVVVEEGADDESPHNYAYDNSMFQATP